MPGGTILVPPERTFWGGNAPPQDLTRQPAFARLRGAADLAEEAGFVSRAEVAELADARGSGPRTRKGVGVRVPSSAPAYNGFHCKSVQLAQNE